MRSDSSNLHNFVQMHNSRTVIEIADQKSGRDEVLAHGLPNNLSHTEVLRRKARWREQLRHVAAQKQRCAEKLKNKLFLPCKPDCALQGSLFFGKCCLKVKTLQAK
jgi:hypothetical protein